VLVSFAYVVEGTKEEVSDPIIVHSGRGGLSLIKLKPLGDCFKRRGKLLTKCQYSYVSWIYRLRLLSIVYSC
jgi:hypothetical protein